MVLCRRFWASIYAWQLGDEVTWSVSEKPPRTQFTHLATVDSHSLVSWFLPHRPHITGASLEQASFQWLNPWHRLHLLTKNSSNTAQDVSPMLRWSPDRSIACRMSLETLTTTLNKLGFLNCFFVNSTWKLFSFNSKLPRRDTFCCLTRVRNSSFSYSWSTFIIEIVGCLSYTFTTE